MKIIINENIMLDCGLETIGLVLDVLSKGLNLDRKYRDCQYVYTVSENKDLKIELAPHGIELPNGTEAELIEELKRKNSDLDSRYWKLYREKGALEKKLNPPETVPGVDTITSEFT